MMGKFRNGLKKALSLTVAACMFVSGAAVGFADNTVATTPDANKNLIAAIEKSSKQGYNQVGNYALKMDFELKTDNKKPASSGNMSMSMDVTGAVNKLQVSYDGSISVASGKDKGTAKGSIILDMEKGNFYFKLPSMDKYVVVTDEDIQKESKKLTKTNKLTSGTDLGKIAYSAEDLKQYEALSAGLLSAMAKGSLATAKVMETDEQVAVLGNTVSTKKYVVSLDNVLLSNITVDFLKFMSSDESFKALMLKNAKNAAEKKSLEKGLEEIKAMVKDESKLNQMKLMFIMVDLGDSAITYYVDKESGDIVKSGIKLSVKMDPISMKMNMDYDFKSDANAKVITDEMLAAAVKMGDVEKDTALKAQIEGDVKEMSKDFKSLDKNAVKKVDKKADKKKADKKKSKNSKNVKKVVKKKKVSR